MEKYFNGENYFRATIGNIDRALEIIAKTDLKMSDMQILMSEVLDANKVYTVAISSKIYNFNEKLHFDADSLEDAENKVKLHVAEGDIITDYIPYPDARDILDLVEEIIKKDEGNFSPEDKKNILKAQKIIKLVNTECWDEEDFEKAFNIFVNNAWHKLVLATERHYFNQEFGMHVEKLEGDELYSWLSKPFISDDDHKEKFLEALENACGIE